MLTSVAARLFSVLALCALPGTSTISGVVVDQHGQPLPRARVQLTNAGDSMVVFTAADGSFHITASPASGCRVVASLVGFADATADCATDGSIRLTLGIAPLQEHVVVTATRTETPTGQVPSGVTVFAAEDIARRQAPTVAELLADAPGASVVRSGGAGSVTSLFVRGGESNYNKVLLDGIPVNEPGGAFDFSNITTENIDRVEFVRGAQSALYGSDAMTSVVQLFTRRPTTRGPEARIAVEGGSFSTSRGSASVAGRSGRADYSAGVARLATDNEVPNDAFRNTTVSGTAALTLSPGAMLRFVGRAERGHAGVPGQTAFGRPDLDGSYSRNEDVWGVSFDQTLGALRQRATYGLSSGRQVSADRGTDPSYTPAFDGRVGQFEFFDFAYDSRTDLRRHHASYQADWTMSGRAGTHIETALVDWDGERATLTDALGGDITLASRNNVGVSLQHQALWARAFVTGGLRVEHNDSFGNAVVPRGSVAYYARTSGGTVGSTRVSASAGLGIKEPTILQSFSTSPFFLGNPDLDPERARTFDVGVEQRFAADRVRVDATWFANRYKDVISTRTISYTPYQSQYFNIGETRAQGAEVSGDVALVSGFRAKGGYTFTASRVVDSTSPSDPVFGIGQWAFRRPRHSGYADLSWTGSRLSADVIATFVGRRVDSDFSALEPAMTSNDGYARWDGRAAARIERHLSLTFAVDNLTGTRYMEPLGYAALGRAVRFGVRARF